MFDEDKVYENSIIINENQTIINLKKKKLIINKKLINTDLYQLINNILSNLINDSNNVNIHSCIIKNEINTIMILGKFNAGKTTISKFSKEVGYKIISADQSWITFNSELEIHKGSLYMAFDNTYEMIDRIKSNIKIDKILILLDINNGTIKYYNINYYHNIKRITKYFTWSTNNVLMTDDIELTLDKISINNYIKKISVPILYASGSSCDTIKKMEEI